ncbi:polysaccharide deacetylase family protein [Massilia sp. ML15P13]|uniref:Polysaccharide deacetylase family protein n=1 Tax=Telluria aromaticivorans TaxID=2725995 RepID=A0A7Y2K035_9BURK|nr:polysaccharide deacetylase family protein [Telluria aromaticivorans]
MLRKLGNTIAPTSLGEGRLCIVNYHRILEQADPLLDSEPTIDTFRWQMDLLANCFNVLPLYNAIQLLGTGRMPPRAIAITFDDGYRSTHDLALPILREYGLAATVFVTTGHIDHGSMWNDVILEATRRLSGEKLELHDIGFGSYPLHTMQDRQQTARALTERSKYLPPPMRARLNRKLETLVGSPLEQELMLTRDMLLTLDRNNIEIGGHTITHPILNCISDDEAHAEIVGNKQELESILGKPLRLFAYPNGKQNIDFDMRHARIVEEAGYDAAFTTAVGPATRHSGRFTIPRSRPWDSHPLLFAGRLLYWLSGKVS